MAVNLSRDLPKYLRQRSDSALMHIAWDGSDFAVFCPNRRLDLPHCLGLQAKEEEQVGYSEGARRHLENMARSARLDADSRRWNMDGSTQLGPARTKAWRVVGWQQDSLARCHSPLKCHSPPSCHVSVCCSRNSLQGYKAVGNSGSALSPANTGSELEMPWLVAHNAEGYIQATIVHSAQGGHRLKLAAVEGEPVGHP